MNKNTLVIAALALVLLVGGAGAYVVMNKNASSNSTDSATTGNTMVGSESSGPMSLKDILLGGVAQKCTFSNVSDNTSVEGVTYVAGGKVRGDFTTNDGTTTTQGHMIADGTTSYMWMDGQDTGFKMAFDINAADAQETPSDDQSGSYQSLDIDEDMNYNCSPWGVDGSMFTPPANVTFTDFSAMTLPSSGTGVSPDDGDGSGGIPNACAACDSLDGDAKTQCLTALNCN